MYRIQFGSGRRAAAQSCEFSRRESPVKLEIKLASLQPSAAEIPNVVDGPIFPEARERWLRALALK
jgi:hypothetical protein